MIKVGNLEITKDGFILIAGPCAVESKAQIDEIAVNICDKIDIFRGGAFKPRTNVNSFQGLGSQGIKLLEDVKKGC